LCNGDIRRRPGVEHEHRWADLANRGFGERGICCVPRNDGDSESSLEVREARGIACDYGDIGVMRREGFNNAQAKPAAAADN
jgi:hypothetical protein